MKKSLAYKVLSAKCYHNPLPLLSPAKKLMKLFRLDSPCEKQWKNLVAKF